MAQAIEVRVDLRNIQEVQKAYEDVKDGLVRQVLKSGATKGARNTIGMAKAKIGAHNRTGQLQKSIGVKYKGYRGAWVVMLGPRKFFRGSAPSWMSPNATTIDPTKYAHILENGRKAILAPAGKTMPIFVRTLNSLRRTPHRAGGSLPWRHARKFSKSRMTQYGKPLGRSNGISPDRAKKVPGGWLLFSQSAREAPAYPWLGDCAPAFASNIENGVIAEVNNQLPALCAKANAAGRNPYK